MSPFHVLAASVLLPISPFQAAEWRAEGDQSGAHFGTALAAGDFNGDGHGDLLVGAPDHDGGHLDEGRVVLYLGSGVGLAAVPSWSRGGVQAGERFGSVLACAGDVNGDGRDDALIGAPDFDASRPRARRQPGSGASSAAGADHGRVWLVLGSSAGLESAPQRVLFGMEDLARLGSSLASAGDVNGDGFDDVLVGATGGRGRILLFAGSPRGLRAHPIWNKRGVLGAGWGRIVGSAGDVNGDGFDDILVSANQFGGPCGNQDVFLGSPVGPLGPPAFTIAGGGIQAFGATRDFDHDGQPESLYLARCPSTDGLSLRGFVEGQVLHSPIDDPVSVAAGDFDGDGSADLVAGNPNFEFETLHGRVSVVHNVGPMPPVGAFPLYDGDQPLAGWGEALAAIDVDGDGADELFVGAPRQDEGELDEGLVVLFPGRPRAFTMSETEDSPFDVGIVGDFNGDGFSDSVRASSDRIQRPEIRYGTNAGLPELPDQILTLPPSALGNRLLLFATGDADADGDDDLYLHARDSQELADEQHSFFLFRGSPAGLPQSASAPITYEPTFLGDVNGDGFEDALGRFYPNSRLYFGSSSGLVAGPSMPELLYVFVLFPSDLDGDGRGDLVIQRYQQPPIVYLGSPTGLVLEGAWSDWESGTSIRDLLDFDGDGRDDLLMGTGQGSLRVYRRTSSGFERAPRWFESPKPACCPDPNQDPHFVLSLDFDGDGYRELMLKHNHRSAIYPGGPNGIGRAPSWIGTLALPAPFRVQQADLDGDGNSEFALSPESYPTSEEYLFEVDRL